MASARTAPHPPSPRRGRGDLTAAYPPHPPLTPTRAPTRGEAPMAAERPTPTGPAAPDLRIVESRVYRGRNIWSYEPVDPPRRRPRRPRGVPQRHPARASPTGSSSCCPGLENGTPAPRGRAGGFVERLREGTWLGHVAEHVALQLQTGGRARPVARQDPRRQGQPGRLQRHLRLHRRAGRPRRRSPRGAARQPPRPARGGVRLRTRSSTSFLPGGRAHRVRAVDRRRSSRRRSAATSPGSGSTVRRSSSSARASTSSGSARR